MSRSDLESNRPSAAENAVSALTSIRDDELLVLIGQRHEAALGVLYDRHIRLVYAIALRITGDRQTAEEVVQDTFQQVWQSAATYQVGRGAAQTWLMGIARHRAIDATRSKRERSRNREQTIDEAPPLASPDGPEQAAVATDERERIRAALATLPGAQRQAIELAYYGDLTRSEIADRLGEPLGTVKTRMRLGLLKLRELLRPHDDP